MRKDISRQRRWQIRKKAEGKCIVCGKERVIELYCEEHRIKINIIHKKWREKKKISS